MGEHLRDIRFRDRIDFREGGQPLFLDAMTITGDAQAHLARPHLADGGPALATLVLVAEDGEAMLEPVRRTLFETGGASLVRQNVLVLRLPAELEEQVLGEACALKLHEDWGTPPPRLTAA